MTGYRLQKLSGPYRTFRGGLLPEVELAYETWGELSPARDNALLLTTGLSPGSHARSSHAQNSAPGWWEGMIGPGAPLDTDRYFVVCNNSLGSCHGSTGPASIHRRSGEPYRLDFPLLSLEDIAGTSRELLKALGITRLKAVVGSSMGGMTALAYVAMFPNEVESLVCISAAAHATPFAIAIRSIQREAIRTDPEWKLGHYSPGHPPRNGMSVARKVGMVSYRSAAEWNERFGRQRVLTPKLPFGLEFEIEAYLQSHADRFVPSFDANSYLYLSKAMDRFDLSEHGSDLGDAFSRLRLRRALVVGVETDILFPLEQQQALMKGLQSPGREVRFVSLPSRYGHDSFLIDLERLSPPVRDFLGGE